AWLELDQAKRIEQTEQVGACLSDLEDGRSDRAGAVAGDPHFAVALHADLLPGALDGREIEPLGHEVARLEIGLRQGPSEALEDELPLVRRGGGDPEER